MTETTGRVGPALRVRYDADADAMVLRLGDGTVSQTVELAEMVYVDLDANGRPLGVEFVVASDFLPFLARHGGELVLSARIDPAAASARHGDARGGGLPGGGDADRRARGGDSVAG